MNKIAIITRCTRPENLQTVANSLTEAFSEKYKWYIIFDNNMEKIDTEYLDLLNSLPCEYYFRRSQEGAFSHDNINWVIKTKVPDKYYVYVLDDDNTLHPEFVSYFKKIKATSKSYIFNQFVDGKDFTGEIIRKAAPENMKVQKVDMGQILIEKEFLMDYVNGYAHGYTGDGISIQYLHDNFPEQFKFIDKILCYYNDIEKPKTSSDPRILYVGELPQTPQTGGAVFEYESSNLNIKHVTNDSNIAKDIYDFNPDAIITRSSDWTDFKNVGSLSYEFRRRWYHFQNDEDINQGWGIYNVANNYILTPNEQLVSIYTSAYNTKENIWTAYNSLKAQTYDCWEWVIVNDSTDGNKTQKILEHIAMSDPRVKIYNFDKKSGGVIGEAKYRAAGLCNGEYLMELDHDDALLPDAIELMVRAFITYPDAGFVYSDCIESDLQLNVNKYPDGFALGYGYYYQETWGDKVIDVNACVPVNPKTIRHIVGVPNHFRAWRKSVYHAIGGYNRKLTIADDYELIVRSFLHTRFVRIPKCEYIQYFYGQNTQDGNGGATRRDIQRRVRSIAEFYNTKIKNRFEELGMEDWAYAGNPDNPLYTPSRKDAPDAAYTLIL